MNARPTPRALVAFAFGLSLVLACDRVEVAEQASEEPLPGSSTHAGSQSCRECHERFYQLWAPSHHGLAMQRFTSQLAREELSPQKEALVIGDAAYRFVPDEDGGTVEERSGTETSSYRIAYALGGKNVYYFLAPVERGRLQVLPVAYDRNEDAWFDTAASGVRGFTDQPDEAVHWTDPALTFNTSCFSCHVSQLETNYDVAADSYDTVWGEPGINCETCHGGAAEHIRIFRAIPEGQVPTKLGLHSLKNVEPEEINDSCGSCHSKSMPLSVSFGPGDRFFDHFDLVTFESRDFYPDGRDLGENYTHTLWLTSPCVQSGEIDCLHCHTSSGRFRQKDDPNQACVPCHEEHVKDPPSHTHHVSDSTGSLCISCHMPSTWFARMERHDHSMRPPTPATTIEHDSPNACNLCHEDQDAQWADRKVRAWRSRDYQARALHIARLVDSGRKDDWSRIDDMVDYLSRPDRDPVFATSLIRLLRGSRAEVKWPALVAALDDPSPLVRGAAAEALGDELRPDSLQALLTATEDDYRLVRIRAATALRALPGELVRPEHKQALENATAELLESITCRPDDAYGYYNLGNLLLEKGESQEAIEAYETAIRLRPEMVPPRVNVAHAYAQAGRPEAAVRTLKHAIETEPLSAAAHFNLGLILGEMGRRGEAIRAHREALAVDPELAAAAYNLGVLLAEEDVGEALKWTRRAWELQPSDHRYGYTLGFFQRQSGDALGAIETLRSVVETAPAYGDAWGLLGATLEEQGRLAEAQAVYRQALEVPELDPRAKAPMARRLQALGKE